MHASAGVILGCQQGNAGRPTDLPRATESGSPIDAQDSAGGLLPHAARDRGMLAKHRLRRADHELTQNVNGLSKSSNPGNARSRSERTGSVMGQGMPAESQRIPASCCGE